MTEHDIDDERCPVCGGPSPFHVRCDVCRDPGAAFTSYGSVEESDTFFGIRLGFVLVHEDLEGRLSEYRGIRLTPDAPATVAEWEARRAVPVPPPDDLSPEAVRARRRARRSYLRHVIAVDRRLPAELASCRVWHELVHAAHREIDPWSTAACREAELDALIDRVDRRDFPTPTERDSLPEETQARRAEILHWSLWPAVHENEEPLLPVRDVDAARIVSAGPKGIVLHPGHAAFWEEYQRRVGAAWHLLGSTAWDDDLRTTVPTAEEAEFLADLEEELRQLVIELGHDPDAPAPEPDPEPEPQPGEISFGRVAVACIPGTPKELIDRRPPLRDVFAATLERHHQEDA